MGLLEILGDLGVAQVVFIVLSLVTVSVFVKSRYFSPISDIPGPLLASFGTCFQVFQVLKGKSDQEILQLHRKHGPFVRISYNEVSVDHPEALREVLAAPLRKGAVYNLFAIPNSNYVNLMSERDPKRTTAIRTNLAPAYTMTNVLRNESYVDKTIALMEKGVHQASQSGQAINFGSWLHFLTWDIMGEVTFSKRFGFLDQARDVGNALSNTFYLGLYVTSMGYMQWLHVLLFGNPILRWLDFQPNEHAYNICVESIATRKKHTEAHVDMMEHWMHLHAKDPERMSETDLFAAVMGNLGGGGDTIGSALQAFFYFMLKNDPRYMATLRQEIDAARLAGELSPVVSYAEARKLPYLQACIKETLRMFPAVGWNLPRHVPPEGLTIAGRRFKAGTVLSVNPCVIHRNKQYFGPDADSFKPERWLDPAASKQLEQFFIPFGLGYNACPGQNLAKLEFSKIAATLVRDFDLRLEKPEQEWRYHRTFIAPQSGWDCHVRRREGAAFGD